MVADTRSQLDDQTKLVSEASQKLASLGQQTLEADKATTDTAAAREEAQKQLAQVQAELGKAIKTDAVRRAASAQYLPGTDQAGRWRQAWCASGRRPAGDHQRRSVSPRQYHVVDRRARSADADGHCHQRCDRATGARYGLAHPSHGHADKQPTTTGGRCPSNWDLSAARAVTIVRSLVGNGIPAKRVAAETFGENQPLDPADTPAAYAKNRRIEIRLTER